MPIHAWGRDDDRNNEECHCGASPPPTFKIPPPPQPPKFIESSANGNTMYRTSLDLYEDIQDTCSVARELQNAEIPSVTINVPVFLVITIAVTLVFLVIIATGIVYRLRHWFVITKGCHCAPTLNIYDGQTSYQQSSHCQKSQSQRLKYRSEHILGIPVTLQLCPTSSCKQEQHEHLYQSISSDSDAYSYATSEATPCHKQDNNFISPLLHKNNYSGNDNEDETIHLHNSPEAEATHIITKRPSTSSESFDGDHRHYMNIPSLDSTLPNLVIKSFNTNNVTSQSNLPEFGYLFPVPCSICGLLLSSIGSTKFPFHHQYSKSPRTRNVRSPNGKNTYYMRYHPSKRSSLSPEDRGLRPLPSRSPRFKKYFIPDHLQQYRENQTRLARQKERITCQCNKNKSKNALHNSSNFNFRYIGGHNEPKSINFYDRNLPDMDINKSQYNACNGQNNGEVIPLPQFSNDVSVARSRNHIQNEIEHLYENCNDA